MSDPNFSVPVSSDDTEELYEHYRIDVDAGQTALRIDKFLMNRLQNVSRNRLQLALHSGNIIVNQKEVKPNYKVRPGDYISVVLAHPPRDIELLCEKIPIGIVYEDDDLVVVNKNAGMVVHPAYGNYSGTLVNALAYHFHPHLEGKSLKSESLRPGLVHRIDKNTSGLLVVAKNEESMTNLAGQFYNRTINRHYIALVWGNLKSMSGTIEGNIGRNLKNRKVMDVFPSGNHGKHAVTHYETIEKYTYTTLVKCKLETGRTHQIRVHFKHLGHPLFGDFEYGGDKILKGQATGWYKSFVEKCFQLMPYQALHAQSLGFIHPKTKSEMFFEVPVPSNFQELINQWKKYQQKN